MTVDAGLPVTPLTVKPRAVRTASAALTESPATDGTGTKCGPLDISIVT